MDKQLTIDIKFLKIAKLIGESSKCLSRKIGSVIVRNGNIVSEGKNGPPKGCKHCDERTSDFYKNLDYIERSTSIWGEMLGIYL